MIMIREPVYVSSEVYQIVARMVLNDLADLVNEVNNNLSEGESYYTMDGEEIRKFCKENYGEDEE